MGKVTDIFKNRSPKIKASVVKTANRADQFTNLMPCLFVALSGIAVGGWVGVVTSLIAIPMALAVWSIPPALSRFSYAAATDKKAMVNAILIALASMFLTTVGLVGMSQYTRDISNNHQVHYDQTHKGHSILLSEREINKCDASKSSGPNGCVVRDHVANVLAASAELSKQLPPFSLQKVRLDIFGWELTGVPLATTVAILLAMSLALIQGFLPYSMAKSGQGSHEDILEGKQNAA